MNRCRPWRQCCSTSRRPRFGPRCVDTIVASSRITSSTVSRSKRNLGLGQRAPVERSSRAHWSSRIRSNTTRKRRPGRSGCEEPRRRRQRQFNSASSDAKPCRRRNTFPRLVGRHGMHRERAHLPHHLDGRVHLVTARVSRRRATRPLGTGRMTATWGGSRLGSPRAGDPAPWCRTGGSRDANRTDTGRPARSGGRAAVRRLRSPLAAEIGELLADRRGAGVAEMSLAVRAVSTSTPSMCTPIGASSMSPDLAPAVAPAPSVRVARVSACRSSPPADTITTTEPRTGKSSRCATSQSSALHHAVTGSQQHAAVVELERDVAVEHVQVTEVSARGSAASSWDRRAGTARRPGGSNVMPSSVDPRRAARRGLDTQYFVDSRRPRARDRRR